MKKQYDVIVIGAGHAGIEACLASSRMGCRTLLITMDADKIGFMSCNPAVGGIGKGQLVKEIDALGGEMAKATDAAGIQFRILNKSKGPAVWSSRAQVDRKLYNKYMVKTVKRQERLDVLEDTVERVFFKKNRVGGVLTKSGMKIKTPCVVVASGTFLNGLIHLGKERTPGGRVNERPAKKLSFSLRDAGINLMRFKTCTPPRIDGKSVDYSRMRIQPGDK
ncbi:MAG: FAD-dependent oxidoreductase, partial [Candidatus Omnitrophica bacterium]|nr:FAD-dependent oxidoreductase [Candidatus Omnitrophota bacterium]